MYAAPLGELFFIFVTKIKLLGSLKRKKALLKMWSERAKV